MVVRLVDELVGKKIVCVPMVLITEFLIECMHRNIVCGGGAFTRGFREQWFYL